MAQGRQPHEQWPQKPSTSRFAGWMRSRPLRDVSRAGDDGRQLAGVAGSKQVPAVLWQSSRRCTSRTSSQQIIMPQSEM